MSLVEQIPSRTSPASLAGPFAPAAEYLIDAAQRSVLFWDVLRERGNQNREHMAESVPHVLNYEPQLIFDGRNLDRPVNYALVRILPPAAIEIDPHKHPSLI